MKRGILFLAAILVLTTVRAQDWYKDASKRIDSLRKANFTLQILDSTGQPVADSIRVDLFKHKFTFGVVMDPEYTPGSLAWDRATMYRYYNAGVAGNAFKWSGIEAQQGVLTYEGFDEMLQWCERVGWRIKGHTLLWNGHEGNYHEVPKWVQDLPTGEQVKEACKNRIIRDMTRYKGRVFEYDVMNEPSHTFYLTNRVGDSINWLAFKWARQADSTAELYVNDYNTIEWEEYGPFVRLVRKMLDNGAPVDGIGIQAHFGGSINTNDVKRRLDSLATLGLPMRITEFDMDVTAQKVTPLNQAIYYARMLRIAFSYPKITGFYFWGLIDGKVWRAGSGIFNVNKEPKPAADSVYNLIHKEWSTHEKGVTDTEGKFTFRGFLGDYHVFAKINGQWKEFRIPCDEKVKDSVIVLREQEGMTPRPRLVKGRVVAPRVVELKFDKKMADPSAQINNFEVFGRVKNPILSASLKEGDSTTIVLNLKNDLLYYHYVVAAYMKGDQKAADSSILDIFGATPLENMIPGIVSASTSDDGSQIIVRLNKNMDELGSNADSIKITVNNIPVSINSITFKDDSSSVLLITLAEPVKFGDKIYFSYKPGTWSSTEGIALPATGNVLVDNKVPNAISYENNASVQLFPNPVIDYCNIQLPNGNHELIIYNVLGKEMYRLSTSQNHLKLDMRKFEKGVYLVKIISNNPNRNVYNIKLNKQ
ncbi:MAG TPA: endo-1,4-beta-xylanase [Bacteroidales bacterium]|nr:endo-1,4-beta-xylanase [Bacteroidales bacterium]HPO65225.1 endo-1,4-beta-xylanase [Bacteroidales bacterium]